MRSFEHLVSKAKGENAHETTHTAHKKWMQKIEKLWGKLNAKRNSEVVRIQDEIRKNKQQI